MVLKYRFLSILFLILFLTSCNNTNSTPARIAPVKPKGCLLEADLNSAGIVGGERIQKNDVDEKRVVLLYSDGMVCTASPIADNILLTAAHCVMGNPRDSFVAFHPSLSCESGFNTENNEITASIKEFISHEQYDDRAVPSAMVGDLALVVLSRKIPAGYPIYKIARPTDVDFSRPIYFFGYGSVGYKKGGAGILRKTSLAGGLYSVDEVDSKVMIDQRAGRGICSGDSGGPGLVNIRNEYQILGVNSYVSEGDARDKCKGKAALVLVDAYREWIEKKMASRGRHLIE